MSSNNLKIGAHFATDKGLIGAVDAAETIGANAIQIFFKSPMNMKNKIKLTEKDAKQTKEAIKEAGIFLVTHGSYLLNLCNPVNNGTEWIRNNLIEDLEFADKCGSVGVIIHMGSQNMKIRGTKTTISYAEALGNMIANIREILNKFKGNAKIILETCSAEGAKIAKTVEQFAQLYNSFTKKEQQRIGLCVDTCHIFVAGYAINIPSGFNRFFQKFDDLIDLSKITCFHMNDSKAPVASRRDRHENIGKGYIYENNMYALRMVKHIASKYSIPLIMETHDKAPYKTYKTEIELIRDLDDLERDIPEEYRRKFFLVKGCQAQVWLVPKFKKGIIDFLSDSDAFISKGMVTILCDIYGNNKPTDIMASDFELLKMLKLDVLLTQGRRNGVFSMLKKIKKYANYYNQGP